MKPATIFILFIKKLEFASAIAVRLTKLTGKSANPIHPKHLVSQKPWFLKYLKNSDKILDLGAGNGQNSIKASAVVKMVIGVDYDDALLQLARKSSNRTNVRYEILNLEKNLPYRDNTFDKILFFDVLEHLVNRSQILKEIKRVLKPNGILLLSVPNKNTSWKKLQRRHGICSFADPDHKIEYSEAEIKKVIGRYFLIKEVIYDKYDTPLRPIYDLIGAFWLDQYKRILLKRQIKANKFPQEASGFRIIASPNKK